MLYIRLRYQNMVNMRFHTFLILLGLFCLHSSLNAQSYNWLPNGGGAWAVPSNWNPNGVPNGQGVSVTIITDVPTDITLNQHETVQSLTYNGNENTNNPFLLYPTGSGVLIMDSISGPATILVKNVSAGPSLGATFTVPITVEALFSGELNFESYYSTDAIYIQNSISEIGGSNFIRIGNVAYPQTIVQYEATHTYTGGTIIYSGSSLFCETGLMPTTGLVTVNGLFDVGNNQTIGNLSGSGTVGILTGTLTFGDATNQTFSGTIAGLGSLTKQGTGTSVLSGTSSYTGTTTITGITGGALQFNQIPSTSSININGNSLIFSLSANGTYAQPITGSGGTLTCSGSGTLALSGTNTYSGDTTISVGSSLQINTLGAISNTPHINNSGSLIFNETLNGSYTHPIQGSGSLTHSGSATLTLSGPNTYTGATTVNAGTLQGGAPHVFGGSGSISALVMGGGTLDMGGFNQAFGSLTGSSAIQSTGGMGIVTLTIGYDNTSPAPYSGAIQGSIALTKVNTGTLILSGANGYTGGTTVANGTLLVNNTSGSGTGTGPVSVTSNGTLGGTGSISGTVDIQNTGTLVGVSSETLTAGGLTLDSGALSSFHLDVPTTTPLISITGTNLLNLAGSSTVKIINNGGMAASTYYLFKYSGDPLPDISNLTLTSSHIGAFNVALVNDTGNLSIDLDVTNLNNQWIKGNVTTFWNDTTNWTEFVPGVAGDVAQFYNNNGNPGFGSSEISQLTSSVTVGTIVFNNTTTAFTIEPLSNQTLTLDNSGTDALIQVLHAPSANHEISASIILPNDLTIEVAGGSFGLDISGAISESGGSRTVTKTNPGPLSFSGSTANTYTGLTDVASGTLTLSKTAGVDAIGVGGLQIDIGAFAVLGASNQIDDSATLTVNGSFDLETYSETIAQLGGGGTVTTGSGSVLTISGNTNSIFMGAIGGTGGIAKAGNGTLTLFGVNTYSGGTAINAGTLQVHADDNLGNGSSNITFNGGTLLFASGFFTSREIFLNDGGGTFDTSNNSVSLTGLISSTGTGVGTLTKNGLGTLDISNANSYTGATIINNGILRSSNSTSLGSSSLVTVNANGELELNGNGLIVNNSLTLNGGILCNLSGTNTFSGPVTLAASSIVDADAETLIISGAIGDGGHTYGITKTGPGIVELSATNTYSGATTVNGGTLQAGAAFSAFGVNSAVTLANTAGVVLDLNFYSNTIGSLNGDGGTVNLGVATLMMGTLNTTDTFAGNITGAGSLTKTGTGTMTLLGVNNYSGGTLVSAGTLQGNAVSLQGAITNNAAVIFNQTTVGTYAGSMSGTGTLTSIGFSTLIFSGTNTYSGTTEVSGGTLQAAATTAFSSNSALFLDNTSGVLLDLNGYSNTIGSLNGGGAAGGNVNLNSATLTTGGLSTMDTFAGTISGTATSSLIKTGTNLLTLTGINSMRNAVVSQGTLAVNNSLTLLTDLTVNPGATLKGYGPITTTAGVNVYGTLIPGNSIGTIVINGDLTQEPNSTLVIEINPTTNDFVQVSGFMMIEPNATLDIVADPGNYTFPFQYHIASAASVVGTFSSLQISSPLLTLMVEYLPLGLPTDIYLYLSSVAFSDIFNTGNIGAVAHCLDTLPSPAGSDLATVIGTLYSLSVTDLESALNQLQPSLFTSLAIVQENDTLHIRDTITHRMENCYHQCTEKKNNGFYVTPLFARTTQNTHHYEPGFAANSAGFRGMGWHIQSPLFHGRRHGIPP